MFKITCFELVDAVKKKMAEVLKQLTEVDLLHAFEIGISRMGSILKRKHQKY